MPITTATFVVGWLAIAGVPPFAGFWSKDEILLGAWDKSPVLWFIGLVTALLTAYYMTRQVRLVFWGDERWRHEEHPTPTEADEAKPAADHHAEAEHAEPHEAPPTMWIPLAVLAFLSVVGGAINLPFSDDTEFLHRWLHPVVGEFVREGDANKVVFAAIATSVALLGLFVGLNAWRRADRPELEPEVLRRAWFIDPLYAAIIERPGRALADFSAWVVDRRIIDGAVNGVAVVVRTSGGQLRRLQTGYVRNYALGVTAGTVAMLAWFLLRAT